MRGRKPRSLILVPDDVSILEILARSRSHSWFQVQHAQILLDIAHGQRVHNVAWQARCDPATVWRICRSYEEHGLDGVLAEAPRPGRPQRLSPPPACPDRAVGLPRTHRARAAHHPLEQFRPGQASGHAGHRHRNQPAHRTTNLARRRFAAAPHAFAQEPHRHRPPGG